MELYLVRHGQSEANIGLPIFNAKLTELGQQQAELLGKDLSDIPFDKIYGSTLSRAAQTAAAVAACQKAPSAAVEFLPELVEANTPNDFAGDRAFLYSLHPHVRMERETMLPFRSNEERAKYVLETLIYQPAYDARFLEDTVDHDNKPIQKRDMHVFIATHGVFMAYLMAELVHFPFDPNMIVSLHNTGVCHFSLFTVNGVRRIRFITHNDTHHLRKDMLT